MPAPHPALAALLDGPAIWHTLVVLEETASTNDVVATRAAEGAPPGLVVVADRQTAGRGRLGRRWQDQGEQRSLLVSVLVDAPPRHASLVPLATGVAIGDALRRRGAAARLKWPNDVLLPGPDGELRKCAGVLVERYDGRLVIGMGINLDWRGADAHADAPGAISVAEVVGSDVDRWAVLADLLRALEAWLRDAPREPVRMLVAYRSRCATIGQDVRVSLPGEEILEGRAVDLTDDGALIVATPRANVTVTAGDVVHVRPTDGVS